MCQSAAQVHQKQSKQKVKVDSFLHSSAIGNKLLCASQVVYIVSINVITYTYIILPHYMHNRNQITLILYNH